MMSGSQSTPGVPLLTISIFNTGTYNKSYGQCNVAWNYPFIHFNSYAIDRNKKGPLIKFSHPPSRFPLPFNETNIATENLTKRGR